MDRNKIREFVRQAHPKRRILTSDVREPPATTASSDDRDVDAGNLKLSNWKKFGNPPSRSTSRRETPTKEATMSTDSRDSDPREKFRPRKLTGGTADGPARPKPRTVSGSAPPARGPRQGAGKIALERLDVTGNGAPGDSAQDSLDLLVDEEHGIIGESDSGPEKRR
jgi:hypothetical protein